MNIDYAVKLLDESAIQTKVEGVKKTLQKTYPSILKESFQAYAENASRNMPPPKEGKKSRSIPAKLYKRNVFAISQMLKADHKNRKELSQKINEGFRFVVYGYIKRGRRPFRWYAKTLREAKSKYQKIRYRGIYKYLWGSGLESLGIKSTMFENLLKKSPDMAKVKSLGAIYLENKNDETKIQAVYKADGIDYFVKKSHNSAKQALMKKMKKLLQSKTNEELKKI